MQQFVLFELRKRWKRGGTLSACVRSANAAVVAAAATSTSESADDAATTSDDVRYGRADGASPATATANALVVLRRR